jgi:hypothetical protein
MPFVFDAYTPPDVRQAGELMQRSTQKVSHPLGPFRQHLKRVVLRLTHDIANLADLFERKILMEHIAHRVHEDHHRRSPPQRVFQGLRNENDFSIPAAIVVDHVDVVSKPPWILSSGDFRQREAFEPRGLYSRIGEPVTSTSATT